MSQKAPQQDRPVQSGSEPVNPKAGAGQDSSAQGASEAAEAFFASAGEGAAVAGLEEQVALHARRAPGWRSPALLVLVIAVTGWLLWGMKGDLGYYLSEREWVDLGDLDGYDLSAAEHDTYAYIEGLPHHLQAQYRQLTTRYKVYPLVGTRVFVRERLQEKEGEDAERYPSFEGSGRLLDIRADRTYANIRSFYREKARFDFEEPAWILLVGQEPRSAHWVPAVSLLLLGILVLNLWLLVRRVLAGRSSS